MASDHGSPTEVEKEMQNLRQDNQRLRQKNQELDASLRDANRKLQTLQMEKNDYGVEIAQLHEDLKKARDNLAEGSGDQARETDEDVDERVQRMQVAHSNAIDAEQHKQWEIQAFFRKVLNEALDPARDEPTWTHEELRRGLFDVSLHSAQNPRNTHRPLELFHPITKARTKGFCVEFCHKRYSSAVLRRPMSKSTFPGLLLSAMTATVPTTTAMQMRSDLHALDSRIMCYMRPWKEQCQSLPANNNVYAHLIREYVIRCICGMHSKERGFEFAHLSCLVTEILCLMVPPAEVIEGLIVACDESSTPRSILGAAGVLRVLQCLRSDIVNRNFTVDRHGRVVCKQQKSPSLSDESNDGADDEEDDVDMQSTSSGPLYAHDNQSLEIILPSFDDDRFNNDAVSNTDLCILDMPSFLQEVCKGDILGPKREDPWFIRQKDVVLVAENGEQHAWLRSEENGDWILTDSHVRVADIRDADSIDVVWDIGSRRISRHASWDGPLYKYAAKLDLRAEDRMLAASQRL